MKLELGHPVRCTDGSFGELADVVIDPKSLLVTHLVVSPRHQHRLARLARLVPIARATAADGEISLSCTVEEAEQFPRVEEFSYLLLGEQQANDPDWDIGIETVHSMPTSSYGQFAPQPIAFDEPAAISYDRVPKGEIEIRRDSGVDSVDGERLGHVDGFILDEDGEVTHVVLERGHLWGRREVTIPIDAVTSVATDSVTLRLTRDQVGELPVTPVHH